MLFKVAWRNIWRNKTRSIVVIASVAAGLFAGVFMVCFFFGMIKEEIDTAVDTQLSHIQIHNPLFGDDKDVNDTIGNANTIIASLQKNSNVMAISGRIVTTGMISSPGTTSGVEIHGIIPEQEKRVSCISQNMVQGSYFTGKKNEIVIGEKLSEKLGGKAA